MSRRSDREGVPRDEPLCADDRQLLRAGATCDVLWEHAEWRFTYGRGPEHNESLMKHLRERPVLPPYGSAAREFVARRYDRLVETCPAYTGMWRARARILRRGES